jgi:excisionase family DNA binding protein
VKKSDREARAITRELPSLQEAVRELARCIGGIRGRLTAMTVEEVAELLHVSERHVYKLVQDGILPHFKVGKAVRFDPDKIADWLEAASEGDAAKLNERGRKAR